MQGWTADGQGECLPGVVVKIFEPQRRGDTEEN